MSEAPAYIVVQAHRLAQRLDSAGEVRYPPDDYYSNWSPEKLRRHRREQGEILDVLQQLRPGQVEEHEDGSVTATAIRGAAIRG